MSKSAKLNLLLVLLTFCFSAALTINITFDKDEILELDAKTVEKNLHAKELYVNAFLGKQANFDSLKNVHNNPALAASLITEFRDSRSIYLSTYYNNELVFWGANRIAPATDAGLKEGSNRLKTQNGWYEAIKKSDGPFSVVCIIPIKAQYIFQNAFLKNTFAPDLIENSTLEIAGSTDKHIYNVRNSQGEYIISVKLKSSITNTFYSRLELWLWLLTALFITILVNVLCIDLGKKGHIKTAVLTFFCYFLLLRLISLHYGWLDTYFNVDLFDPRHFSGGYFYTSLGDFLINAIMVSWFLCFLYTFRPELRSTFQPPGKIASLTLFVCFALFVYLIASQQSDLFNALITRSNINFDLTNILYLNAYSWAGILLMCLAAFHIFLIIEIVLYLQQSLLLSNRLKLQIFIAGIVIISALLLAFGELRLYLFLFACIILLRAWSLYNRQHSYRFLMFLLTLLLFSIIASVKLSSFQFLKEREHRKVIANNLESAEDPNAVLLFFSLEQDISKDEDLIEYFKAPIEDKVALQEKLQKTYLDGYLSRYDVEVYTQSPDKRLTTADSLSINSFKSLVMAGSIKVSENFYQVNNTFGFQNYFAILPVKEAGRYLGSLIISLKSKAFTKASALPPILVDGKMNTSEDLDNYSFAFYLNGRLLNQSGSYIYNLVNSDFSGKIAEFVFFEKNGYSHLVYKPNQKKTIVVSKPLSTWVMKLASVSFLFLVMIIFTTVILIISRAWETLGDDRFRLSGYSLMYLLDRNRILYRTRIQASLVGAIVFTLLIISMITYDSISSQFRKQMESDVLNNINLLNNGLENNKMFHDGLLTSNEQALRAFADINVTDLNIFDLNGKLLFTTQPKIYENGFIEPRINALAYIYLKKYQRSEYLNKERIGRMGFIAAYQPVRNSKNETVAYVSLPYYTYEHDYEVRIGQYLNTLINVYALVLVVIALFAIFLANKITYPLTLVGKNLSEVKIGGLNEPIKWNSNDEIGSLIKEYNKMISALEQSAVKLARSERESAWREMAKQVAHEIKNPLTPLKLGVQLLDKSWKENDPNFSKKFEKFSKSFIEQIENLSLIASEFSNFAKLPDTPFEDLNIVGIIEKAVAQHQRDDLDVSLKNSYSSITINGNKDHLMKIFDNLLKNAIEAIPEYRKGRILIKLSISGNHTQIEVSDNGRGIPEELSEKIFNPNFTTKSSGTGLGLAYVKQAVENMLGTIDFKTKVNEGTTFLIVLPLASNEKPVDGI